jgi:hypothetical protein
MSLLLALIFGVVGLLRWLTTSGAIWWLRKFGRSYRNKLQEHDPSELTGHKIREILEGCGGGRVRPWGVLEYKAHEHNLILGFLCRWVYRLPTLPLLTLIAYFGVGFRGSYQIAWSIVATIYQVTIILAALEAMYSYIAIGGYRRYYQVGIRLGSTSRPHIVDDMYELDVILPLGLSAIAVNVLAFSVAQIAWSSFSSSQIPLDSSRSWALLIQSTYFVVTSMTTVGYGDIVPRTLWGQVVSMLIHVQSLSLIIGLFATMISFGIRLADTSPSNEPRAKEESPRSQDEDRQPKG